MVAECVKFLNSTLTRATGPFDITHHVIERDCQTHDATVYSHIGYSCVHYCEIIFPEMGIEPKFSRLPNGYLFL